MSVSKEIINVLDALTEKFGLAIDWTAENIIPYFEQLCGKYVNYEIATSIAWLVLGIILIVLGCISTNYSIKNYKKSNDKENYTSSERFDYDMYSFIFLILMVVGFVAGIAVTIEQVFDIITCCTFPEKIILEEMKYLYDSMK